MYCPYCGNEVVSNSNFCSFCGAAITETTTTAVSLLNKAVSTANEEDRYNLVLVSNGTCDKTTCGDLMEDVFGYTDAESTKLIRMMPVVIGENLTSAEAATIAQMFAEYGAEVSVTNDNDQYVDLTGNAVKSVFDSAGNLLAGAAAIIGALTVANRVSRYKRYKKPSLLERLFHLNFKPEPPKYHRTFRKPIEPVQQHPRTIRKPEPVHHRKTSQPGHIDMAHTARNTGRGGKGPRK